MILDFDSRAARLAGEIRAMLEGRGEPIGQNDLKIAAIAMVNGCTLVTHNVREFSRVRGLEWEDWEV
jgi:tRNA(fMet)-specific endonuclease VapC